jgi:hypothetical protein
VIAQRPPQNGALVQNFANHNTAGDRRGPIRRVSSAILGAPKEHVAADRSLGTGKEATVLAEPADGDAALGTEPEQRRRNADPTKSDDAVHTVNRDLGWRQVVTRNSHAFSLPGQVGAFSGDVEGIAEASHGLAPQRSMRIRSVHAAAERPRERVGRHTSISEQERQ